MGGSAATSRTILSVIGPHSGSGKTVFVTRLLRCLGGGLGCLKVRPLHRRHDARTPADQAGSGRYFMEDSADLDRVGMDTEQYLQAGAKQVEILRHEGAGLDPWAATRPRPLPHRHTDHRREFQRCAAAATRCRHFDRPPPAKGNEAEYRDRFCRSSRTCSSMRRPAWRQPRPTGSYASIPRFARVSRGWPTWQQPHRHRQWSHVCAQQ